MKYSYIRLTEPTGIQHIDIDANSLVGVVTYLEGEGLESSDVEGGFTMPATSIRVVDDPDKEGIVIDVPSLTYNIDIGTDSGEINPIAVRYVRTG